MRLPQSELEKASVGYASDISMCALWCAWCVLLAWAPAAHVRRARPFEHV